VNASAVVQDEAVFMSLSDLPKRFRELLFVVVDLRRDFVGLVVVVVLSPSSAAKVGETSGSLSGTPICSTASLTPSKTDLRTLSRSHSKKFRFTFSLPFDLGTILVGSPPRWTSSAFGCDASINLSVIDGRPSTAVVGQGGGRASGGEP
jgi:hypothetical protein